MGSSPGIGRMVFLPLPRPPETRTFFGRCAAFLSTFLILKTCFSPGMVCGEEDSKVRWASKKKADENAAALSRVEGRQTREVRVRAEVDVDAGRFRL